MKEEFFMLPHSISDLEKIKSYLESGKRIDVIVENIPENLFRYGIKNKVMSWEYEKLMDIIEKFSIVVKF